MVALRNASKQSSMDCAETQQFDATQAAFQMEQDAIPIMVEDSLPHALGGEVAMCRSLARDFSKTNLSEQGQVSKENVLFKIDWGRDLH